MKLVLKRPLLAMLLMKIITMQLLLWSGSPSDWKWPQCSTLPCTAGNLWVWFETIEYQSFVFVEEGVLSRKLTFDCGHSHAEEEHTLYLSANLSVNSVLYKYGSLH